MAFNRNLKSSADCVTVTIHLELQFILLVQASVKTYVFSIKLKTYLS